MFQHQSLTLGLPAVPVASLNLVHVLHIYILPPCPSDHLVVISVGINVSILHGRVVHAHEIVQADSGHDDGVDGLR